MNHRHRQFLQLSGALIATSALALLAGCKGNTSSAAGVERRTSAPPIVCAYPIAGDATTGDPLSNSLWTNANWMPLIAPANTDRTTAPVSAAILYDSTQLYVGFIASRSNPAFREASGMPAVMQDMVSVYLDSSKVGNGPEILQVTVNATGIMTCAWIRDAEPPVQPKADGSPEVFHPVSRITDVVIPGLFSRVSEGTRNGESVWTAVVGLPLKSLPMPLRGELAAGTSWKVNLLRTTLLAESGGGTRQLQANLSPVYVAQQAVSPYRMSELRLMGSQVSSLASPGMPIP